MCTSKTVFYISQLSLIQLCCINGLKLLWKNPTIQKTSLNIFYQAALILVCPVCKQTKKEKEEKEEKTHTQLRNLRNSWKRFINLPSVCLGGRTVWPRLGFSISFQFCWKNRLRLEKKNRKRITQRNFYTLNYIHDPRRREPAVDTSCHLWYDNNNNNNYQT